MLWLLLAFVGYTAAVPHGKILQVWKANPGLQRLEVRDDYKALHAACKKASDDCASQLFFGCFLHGLYHRSAVSDVLGKMDVSQLPGPGSRTWWPKASEALQRGLKAACAYKGAKSLPYQVPGGVLCWKRLMPHRLKLLQACRCIAAMSNPTFAAVDEALPLVLGPYSLLKNRGGLQKYMRRHLARFLSCFLQRRLRVTAKCWELSVATLFEIHWFLSC